ncbi:ROK family transcriptional regulator [Pseudarthrobacter sp. B4EP4b]|uniref:ROK family transcriptional regulator n=1 Tax=Pseudarthrobacter sp. B4EP4b TaxID=2590664 RepID=UPI00114D66FB|nr:ROK family transcriptional regulator [Pseudarthrobacter sp. B4EP4b]
MTVAYAPSGTQTSRGLILDRVRAEGPVSRVELAERTGLTQASISNLVRALLDEGLLLETGERTFTGAKGKPRVLLGLNPRARCSVGVQIGADWIVLVLTDAAGSVLARTRIRGARSTPPGHVVRDLAEQVAIMLRLANVERDIVAGIGVVAPGALDVQAGSILASPSMPLWEQFPVRDALERASGLPTLLDNVATAAAMGDFWSGTIPDATAHCTIYMGASISAGLLISGSIYRGASSNTGPLGSVRFQGDRRSGQTLEEVAGPRAVAERARAAVAAGRTTTAKLSDDHDPFSDFAAIATAAVHGDPLSMALIEESADYLADAVVALVNILDLDSVTLAGPSFTTAGSLYLPLAERRLRSESFALPKHTVTVKLSAQVTDAASVGAAALMLQHSLSYPA